MQDAIPRFRLPLLEKAEEPIVELEQLLAQIYEEAALEIAIDYTKQPVPPLSEAAFQWVQQQLSQQS